ncbi:PAS domain-containing protein [Candidatus Peregrinibacteria bacterium]|jgi:PAS domain S-box-containing protein|nr:PAS domain-containing protein [Candidatus Peregrinibacteria bacterium]MBT4055593.1 PAS domain-containing protein [Candidatus Peregrinibacteria bacterium]
MPLLNQNNKIAVVAVSIFLASFVSMLVFMNGEDTSPEYLKSDVLDAAKEHGVDEGGSHGVHFSGEHGEESGGGHGEEADVDTENLYRVLTGHYDEPIFALEPTGRTKFLSEDFSTKYGYELDGAEEGIFFSYIYPSDLAEFMTEYTDVIQSGKAVDRVGPYRFVNKDGGQCVHLLSLMPVVDEETGKVTEVIGSVKDITETLEDFVTEKKVK